MKAREKMVICSSRHLYLLLAVLSVFTACGGGTTGTSSTGELRLFGKVVTSDGDTVAQRQMSVVDATTSDEILKSQTDDTGKFAMTLQHSAGGVSLLIDGHRSDSLKSKFDGDVSISSLVTLDENQDLLFAEKLETKISVGNECRNTEIVSGTVFITNNNEPPICNLIVATKAPVNSIVSVLVQFNCSGEGLTTFDESITAEEGTFTIPVNQLVVAGCTSGNITITSSLKTLLPLYFPIEPLSTP